MFCYSILFRLWPFHMTAQSSWQLECFGGRQKQNIGLGWSAAATYQLCLPWVSSSILKHISCIMLRVNDGIDCISSQYCWHLILHCISQFLLWSLWTWRGTIGIAWMDELMNEQLQFLSTVFGAMQSMRVTYELPKADLKLNFYYWAHWINLQNFDPSNLWNWESYFFSSLVASVD